jgi:hypothetical protein
MSSPAKVSGAAADSRMMDKLGSILQTGLGGVQRGLTDLRATAHEVATAPGRDSEATELAEPLVRALEQQRAIEAAAKVLEHATRAIDSLLVALHR